MLFIDHTKATPATRRCCSESFSLFLIIIGFPDSSIIIKYNIQPIFNLYITIVMYLTYNINEKKSIINKNL